MTRLSEGCVHVAAVGQTVLVVVLSSFHLSLVMITLPEPANVFVPDLVMMLMTPPSARPYSAPTPDVMTETSWIASKLRLPPKVPMHLEPLKFGGTE